MYLIQFLDQGIIRIFRSHYTNYTMERIVNAMVENPYEENILKVWKSYTIEDIIIIIEKALKDIKLKVIHYWSRK